MQTNMSQTFTRDSLNLQALQSAQRNSADLLSQLLSMDVTDRYAQPGEDPNLSAFNDVLNQTLSATRSEETAPDQESEPPLPLHEADYDQPSSWDAPHSDPHHDPTQSSSIRQETETTEPAQAGANETTRDEASPPEKSREETTGAKDTPASSDDKSPAETTSETKEASKTESKAEAPTVTEPGKTVTQTKVTQTKIEVPVVAVEAAVTVTNADTKANVGQTKSAAQGPEQKNPQTTQPSTETQTSDGNPKQKLAPTVTVTASTQQGTNATSGTVTVTNQNKTPEVSLELSLANEQVSVKAQGQVKATAPLADPVIASAAQNQAAETKTAAKQAMVANTPEETNVQTESKTSAAVSSNPTLSVQQIQKQAATQISKTVPIESPTAPKLNLSEQMPATGNEQPTVQMAQAVSATVQSKAAQVSAKLSMAAAGVSRINPSAVTPTSSSETAVVDLNAVPSAGGPQNVTASSPNTMTTTTMGTRAPSLLNQVTENIQVAIRQNQKELVVQLNPPELGRIGIRFTQDSDGIVGVVRVSERQTQQDLEQLMPQILQNLESNGTSVKRIEVELQAEPDSSQTQTEPQDREATDSQAQERENDPQAGGTEEHGSETVTQEESSPETETVKTGSGVDLLL